GDSKDTILAMEYWCNDDEPLWSEDDDQLIERAKGEIRKTGLIEDAEIANGAVRRVHRCYPIYRRGYKEHLSVVTEYLKSIEALTPIGRYGSFKYNNQDHSI